MEEPLRWIKKITSSMYLSLLHFFERFFGKKYFADLLKRYIPGTIKICYECLLLRGYIIFFETTFSFNHILYCLKYAR